MTVPTDRLGVFVVAARDEPALHALNKRAEALMLEDARAWYLALHELFEQAIARSLFHRIIPGKFVRYAWTDFVEAYEQTATVRFDDLSPTDLRRLLGSRLDEIEDEELRAALADALAGPPGGIWVRKDLEMPPHIANPPPPPDDEDGDDVDPAELARRLHEYVSHFDSLAPSAPIERATAAELDAATAKAAGVARRDAESVACARIRARAKVETVDPAVVRATRQVVAEAPVSRGRGIYDVAGARALLAWLETSAETPAHAWLLPAVRRAVAAKRGIGIVFDIE